MRLLLLSHGSGPYGAERVLIALAAGLEERGHDVVVDFPHEGPAVELAKERGLSDIRVTARHRLPRNVREGVSFVATGPAAVVRTGRTIRAADPDLIWVNSLYNPWGAVAAATASPPVVWHLHEYRLPEPLGAAAAALIGATATRVATISRFVTAGWSRYRWLRRKFSILENPLLEPVGPVGRPDGPFTVGYVGQLEPRKRVTDMIQAVARLTDVRGVIVGGGKDRNATEAAIGDTKTSDRIELVGYQKEVQDQLARFHCLAIPSLREPFGLVALEAMDAGVPVVAARSGALPDVLGNAALYHQPGDPDGLARQIRKLKDDPALRDTLAERGRRRAQRFRWDDWLDRAEEIARDAIESRGGS